MNRPGGDSPDSSHETVNEELVLLCRGFFTGVPDLAVAALHEPLLEVYRVRDVWVRGEGVGGEREGLECCVEIGDAVLREETDEVEATERHLAW